MRQDPILRLTMKRFAVVELEVRRWFEPDVPPGQGALHAIPRRGLGEIVSHVATSIAGGRSHDLAELPEETTDLAEHVVRHGDPPK